jgi:CotS family spore coat protein
MDLQKEIKDCYALDVFNVSAYRDSYIVETSIGKKLFKKAAFSPLRISFINSVKDHLKNNGFAYLDAYVQSIEDKPYIMVEEECYTLSDYYHGRECNFENNEELRNASRLLAKLHKAGKGFKKQEGILLRSNLGLLPVNMNKRLENIKKASKLAKRGKEQFDYFFLKYCDNVIDLGEKVIGRLNNSSYSKLVEDADKNGSICHHDFTHQNLVNNSEGLFLINFEQCCLELKEYDIANFMRRKLRRCSWDVNQAKAILNEYINVLEISPEEFEILMIILKFPQKFWRVINRYYNGRHNWSQISQVNALHEVVEEIEQQKSFFEDLDKWAKIAL